MIQLDKKDFLSMPYAVKADRGSGYKAEADISQRTVDFVGNTYYYFDSYGDVLVPGCCAKSIGDRGPQSKAPGKIKHFANHTMDNSIGLFSIVEEATINNFNVLHLNSWMYETELGEQKLYKYKKGGIDQHSIGFRYLNLRRLSPTSSDEDIRKAWDALLSKLINPEDAIEAGFMWEVKEIDLWEVSSLDGFGANRLTPSLGVKSDNINVQYNNLITKLDALHTAMRSGGEKETMLLQERQIKQMIYELYNPEPDLKDTSRKPSPKSTFDLNSAIGNFHI